MSNHHSTKPWEPFADGDLSAAQNSTPEGCAMYNELTLYVKIDTRPGVETLDVILQSGPDDGEYYDHTTESAMTESGMIKITGNLGEKVRVRLVPSASGTWNLSVKGVFKT